MPTPSLPPLAAVRVFEAAARNLSFTKAAAELGMTQAAVSYQIKLLEERIGVLLFLRQPRQVVLTEAGQRFAPRVTEAFQLIGEAYASVRDVAEGTLVISTIQTFGSNWLARRLGSFQLRHPSLAVKLQTDNRMVDFSREEADVGIRSGNGGWAGLVQHSLFRAHFSPMLSPGLLGSIGGVREPADLLKLPILDPRDPWWDTWFTAAGVADTGLASRTGTSMGSQASEANAATAGQGVAILTPAFVAAELADGRLASHSTWFAMTVMPIGSSIQRPGATRRRCGFSAIGCWPRSDSPREGKASGSGRPLTTKSTRPMTNDAP